MKHIILIKLFILFLFISIVGKSQNVFFPSLETDSVDVTWYVTHANGLIYQHSATVGQLRDSLSLYYNKEQVDSIVIELMDTISINSQHIDSLWIRVLELPQTVRHIDLSELGWTESGHTGDESTIAAFDETGQPSFIGSDSLLFENDSTWLATRHDLDTLHQKTIDSLLIHRTEIDELKNRSDENSDLHVEVGRLKNLGNHSINVIFSKPFVNQPIGEEPQIYRIEKFKGNYRREKMLWGWTDANQPINTGFSLNIDNSESLANVVIEYTYIELLQDWILKTGFWNMQGTWKMDKTWKF